MNKIAVIGAGYVGLTTAVGLSELGHQVSCLEIDNNKVNSLNSGKSTIYEKGLEALLAKNLGEGRLRFTTNAIQAIANAEFIFVCVQTPQDSNGAANLEMLDAAIEAVKPFASESAIWVTKSTVPVGTAERISRELLDGNNRIASNPEFLREGTSLEDFFHPERIVIGSNDATVADALADVYKDLNVPVIKTGCETAELIKYAANAFLATKLSFINEISVLCDELGADVNSIRYVLGLDSRIGPSFLQNGPGWGGSCFPKDVSALVKTVTDLRLSLPLIQAILPSNAATKAAIVRKVTEFALPPKKIAVWGLTFKAGTDDLRDSPALEICSELLNLGYDIVAYDPTVNAQMSSYSSLKIVQRIEDSLHDADGLIVLTEWQEFALQNFDSLAEVKDLNWIFDTRNVLNSSFTNTGKVFSLGKG